MADLDELIDTIRAYLKVPVKDRVLSTDYLLEKAADALTSLRSQAQEAPVAWQGRWVGKDSCSEWDHINEQAGRSAVEWSKNQAVKFEMRPVYATPIAVPAQAQEAPVAWRGRNVGKGWSYLEAEDFTEEQAREVFETIEPLYATPIAVPPERDATIERLQADLETAMAQAYQVIGCLLSGPDGEHSDFDSDEGQRALDYFSSCKVDENFLPFSHPRAGQAVPPDLSPTRDELLQELAVCRDLATLVSGHDDSEAIADPLCVADHVSLALGIPPEHRCAVPPEREGWQPIETAPKDETRVLLAKAGKGYVTMGRWVERFSRDHYVDGEHGWFNDATQTRIWNPTHWMPLPEAPRAMLSSAPEQKT